MALYRVISLGDRRGYIYEGNADRTDFLLLWLKFVPNTLLPDVKPLPFAGGIWMGTCRVRLRRQPQQDRHGRDATYGHQVRACTVIGGSDWSAVKSMFILREGRQPECVELYPCAQALT